MMDPTPFFLMGMMTGCGATLFVQAYGRRKVRLAARLATDGSDDVETNELRHRVSVLERITTDVHRPIMLDREIEQLR
jgi:hypothetical protein